MAAAACSARPHDVVAGRELLRERIHELPRLRAIVGDRAYRGLEKLASRRRVALEIKAPPPGLSGFVPLRPLYRIEHAFAQLGRWRRLSRCYEGSAASARAWLEVASVGYLVWCVSSDPPPQGADHQLAAGGQTPTASELSVHRAGCWPGSGSITVRP